MAKAHKITGVAPQRSYRANARIILPQTVEEVYRWEPFIRNPAQREELHNMRIAIKRLRYTMELFGVVYEPKKRFTDCLAVIVDLQEILGDVHDSDVTLDVLTDSAYRAGDGAAQDALAPGVATLIARTKETRKTDYETFLEKWEHLSATSFKQKLLAIFSS